MEKYRKIHIGNIEIWTGYDVDLYKYGMEAIIHSKNGQCWELPLEDIEPDDLRNLADLMESERKEYEENLLNDGIKKKKVDIRDLYRDCKNKDSLWK